MLKNDLFLIQNALKIADLCVKQWHFKKRLIFSTPCHFFRVPISEADPYFWLLTYAFFDQKQAENRHISCCVPEGVGYYLYFCNKMSYML